MRYFVVTPMAAFLMFLLLLLMVQLAGITAQLKPVSSPLQDELLFDSSELTVAKQAAIQTTQIPPAMQEAQLQESIQEFEPQAELEMSELAQANMESPSDELFEDVPLLDDLLLDEPLVNDALLTSKFNSDDNTDLLANVAINKAVRKKVKRVARSKKQQLKTIVKKTVAKLSPTKTVQTKRLLTKSMAQGTATQQTSSPSSAQAGSSQSIASTPLSRAKPKYPKRARRRGVEGVVTVAFVVNKNGTVAKNTLRIVSAQPAKVFNKAVISAVVKWRFAVNKRSYRTQQRLVFSLQKN
ncbi:MAG: TonB family protein [Oceanospirillaceae bacterium]|jgi:TonB family protein